MRLIRVIPRKEITNEVLNLHQFGFILVWREDSLQVWAEVAK